MASNPTPEFRAEAVRVALSSGLPRKQVAADFGVGFSTLSRWIQQDRRTPEKPPAQSDLEREVAELRKEPRMLREEREVLKKASQFYAERSKRGSLALRRTLPCCLLSGCVRSWMSAPEGIALSATARSAEASEKTWWYLRTFASSSPCLWAAMVAHA